MRCFEIASIKMGDINGCEIKIHGKGGKIDYTYLDETLCHMMNVYLATRDTDSDFLFYGTRGQTSAKYGISPNGIWKRVKRCALQSGISAERATKIATHTFRRTAITDMAYKHGNRLAQDLARHASFATTNRYITRNTDALRKVMTGETQ
jgi:integrase